MPLQNAQKFAEDWVNSWNNRDLEAILSHYREDIRFFSPIAGQVVGKPAIEGKPVLADYWTKALARITHLKFTLEDFTWSAEKKIMAIYYIAELNDQKKLVCESLWFDEDGIAWQAWACYGPEL